jgi:hypothetical protein
MAGSMAASKFLEYRTLREVARAADDDAVEAALGDVLVLGDARWRVVGTAPNPNRPGERLVFVERVDRPPTAGPSMPGRDDR